MNQHAPQTASFARAFFFFLCLLSLLTSYYLVKPASRTLAVTYIGSEQLPLVWILSAVVLAVLLPFYNMRLRRHSPRQVICGSLLSFAVLLLAFRMILDTPNRRSVAAFYILVDVYSVVLIEQFWSLAAASYRTKEGKRWYGFVGSGALLGGALGGYLASLLVSATAMRTVDLLAAAAVIVLVLACVLATTHSLRSLDYEPMLDRGRAAFTTPLDLLRRSPYGRYAAYVAALLLFSQLVSPLVEFAFLYEVENSIPTLEARTVYVGSLFSVLSAAALVVNLIVTPVVHERLGVRGGLLATPLLIAAAAALFALSPTLLFASVLKVADRGMCYSIYRASKELLYIPLPAAVTFRLKAWVDMFGYRLFKVLSSSLILIVTAWLAPSAYVGGIAALIAAGLAAWIWAIRGIYPLYTSLEQSLEEDAAGSE